MSRTAPSLEIGQLACRLTAYDSAVNHPATAGMPAEFRVVEKLRRPLSTLARAAGFRSLLARSLTLAKAQAPRLSTVRVKPDGSLEGLHGLGDQDQAAEAGVVLIAELLGLLVTFIGESLMLSLVLEVWPEFPVMDTEYWRKDRHDATS